MRDFLKVMTFVKVDKFTSCCFEIKNYTVV